MSGLSALKFVATKRQQGSSPAQARRQKLSNKIHEQLQLANCSCSWILLLSFWRLACAGLLPC